MALLDSKQLNPKLTGSFILSGSTQTFIGESEFTGSITVTDNLNVSQFITHEGDANTRLNFTDDRIQTEVGGLAFIGAHKKGSTPHQVTINNGGNHIDFVVKDNDNDILFRTDADEDNVLFPTAKQISGSAISTGSFGELEVNTNTTVGGDLFVSENIRHTGDTNTRIRFTDNKISFDAGDMTFFAVHDDDSAPFTATINGGGNKINFRALDENQDLLLKTDSEAFSVELYHAGNKKLETTSTGIDITGQITASGNVSSSATSIFSAGTFIGKFDGALSSSAQIATDISGSFSLVSASLASRITSEEGEAEGSVVSSSAQIAADISGSFTNPSGNVSGSSISTGSFGRLEAAGDISVGSSIRHGGDSDTRILFTDDDINIAAGGKNFVDFTEDTVSEVTFNEEGVDIDFRVESENDNKAIYVDGSQDSIQLGSASTTHVTASGNISASGIFTAEGLVISDDANITDELTVGGKVVLSREPIQGFNYLARQAEGKLSSAASAHTFTATAATKTSNHPYKDSGSSLGYIIDGVESPFLYLTEGYYKFDYSGASSHPIRFYFDAAKTTQYNPSTHVSVDGNVITLLIDKDSPQIIYYQCSSHGYMGWAIHTGQNALVQDINGFRTLVSGSAQLAADISGSFSKEHLGDKISNVVTSSAQLATDISGSFSKEHLGDKVANVVTSSAQIATDISGSSTALSASLSTRLTTFDITQIDIDGADDIGAAISDADLIILDDGAGGTNRKATMSRLKSYMGDISGGSTLGNIQVGVTAASEVDTSAGNLTLDSAGGTVVIDDNLQVSGVTTIGDVTVTGTLTAQEVHTAFESASILFTSGSTKLGNSMDDVHNITGSVNTTGSMSADSFEGTFVGALSSSAQISADISGSFSKEHLGDKVANVVTSSAQLAADISGSLGSNASVIRTLTRDTISGSCTTTSSSLASRITIAEDELENTLVSGSAQLAADISGSLGSNADVIRSLDRTTISGSFTSVSSSLASRITAEEAEAEGSVVSSSAQLADDISGSLGANAAVIRTLTRDTISGSFTSTSSSLASRITVAEDELGETLISSSAQLAADISGSLGANAAVIRTLTRDTISGSFTSVSESIASRLTAEEGEAEGSVISSSAQIAADISGSLGDNADVIRSLDRTTISGSFNAVSASLASRITSEEGEAEGSVISSSAQIAADISGSVVNPSGNISGSATSTGSFGEVQVGGMSIESLTTFSSSVATKLDTLDADIIALSIALG